MHDRHLNLFIPGLFGSEELKRASATLERLDVAILETWLSRARRSAGLKGSPAEVLFGLFGIPVEQDADLPVAAVTRLLDLPDEVPGFWLRADPVHLKADRDRLVLFGNAPLHISREEADQLASEFNELFGADGLTLKSPCPNRWYLKVEGHAPVRTTPLSEVEGQSVDPLLPQGNEAIFWHRLLNEVQMLFHNSRVNQMREMRRLPTINSVWFWGGGDLPAKPPAHWQRVWTNEFLGRALAAFTDTPCVTAPSTGEDWLEQADGPGEHLVVLDGAVEAVKFHDIQAWQVFVEGIEQEWVQPLQKALKSGDLRSLRLLAGDGREFLIDAGSQRRWWKRRRALVSQ